jgi:hypothetical protein
MWCWHQWSNWSLYVVVVSGMDTSHQLRRCVRCGRTQTAFVCMGDLLASDEEAPEAETDDEPEGRMH